MCEIILFILDQRKRTEQYKKDIAEIRRKVDEEMREKFGDYMND